MFNYKVFLLTGLVFFLSVNCFGFSSELTGTVQNGLNGQCVAGAIIYIKETEVSTITDVDGRFVLKLPPSSTWSILEEKSDSSQYLEKTPHTTDLVLQVVIEQFQQLEYRVNDRVNNLTLGILPETMTFKEENYFVNTLQNTAILEENVQWEKIIDGVRLYHENRLESLKPQRERYWKRNSISDEAYGISVKRNRRKFRTILGAVDEREPVLMSKKKKVGETDLYVASEICWSVLKEISPRPPLQDWPILDVPTKIQGEGLLIEPKGKSKGFIVAIPDADQEPESIVGLKDGVSKNSQFARQLAENGYTVVIPVIIDRTNRWSRGTNRTSRSWIYAQAHEMGRTVTGYEVQKIEALIDWFQSIDADNPKIGIAGYGEGGLIALYTAALDTRVNATLVSGYFAPREEIWKEPIYRNLWGLLKEFGDAEIASLIAPRSLVVEYSPVPFYDENKNDGTKIEPSAELWTHTFSEVESEFNRIASLTGENIGERVLIKKNNDETISLGSDLAIKTFVQALGNNVTLPLSDEMPVDFREEFDYSARMGRMVEQMVGHTQLLLRDSEYVRNDFTKEWNDQEDLRDYFREELIGWTHDDLLPINPRSKLVEDQPEYKCYEILIDVLPNVEMWGVLTIPKGIENGEKRPIIVMQHGRGGNPFTALDEENSYFGIGRRLAEKGFVIFTPFGNWTGETRFRWIDRIAKPAKNTLWSTVGRQHQQLIRWFNTVPFIDSDRIAIYGKSIGGQAASLIASMIPEYALSINCAYFNESARKESSIYFPTSFVYHVDSEMPMWNRGHTLEYAEMSNRLIFPRPFMVEHGTRDGIAPPRWVEYEYNKIHTYYNEQSKGDRTELDLHEGGHIINAVKTMPFLSKHLNWQLTK